MVPWVLLVEMYRNSAAQRRTALTGCRYRQQLFGCGPGAAHRTPSAPELLVLFIKHETPSGERRLQLVSSAPTASLTVGGGHWRAEWFTSSSLLILGETC